MDTLRDPLPSIEPVGLPSDATTIVPESGGTQADAPAVQTQTKTQASAPTIDIGKLTDDVKQASAFIDDVLEQVGRVVVGQKEMVERILIGLLTGGHCLIEGVPGLAKTLTVKTLSQTINASFQRIQFTPDLLPADITGTIIYNMHTGQFTQKRGPLFANLVLADEVNR
ncbi:MAG: AAA family ATPase, partial [Kofleriaceae bacterium]|nr:AAA family ATPase [Kofleriaceae bacterium]